MKLEFQTACDEVAMKAIDRREIVRRQRHAETLHDAFESRMHGVE